MVENIEARMEELKKKLETMTRTQLAAFIRKNHITLKEKFKELTKEQIIEKVVFDIHQQEFWTEYYS